MFLVPPASQAIVFANGILPLCKMLYSSNSLEAQTRAVGTLFNLASTAAAQKKIADSGGIELLVEQVST